MTPECQGLDLASFLLKPIQRICKYPLLLKELLKNTPESDLDYKAVQKGLIAINGVVSYVNNKRGEAELRQKMFQLLAQMEPHEV
jgi:RhoGEF domain